MSGLPGDPRTDTDGYYTGAVPSGWTGTVTPTLPAFTFDPENIPYSDVTSDQANQDYSANYVGGQDDAYEENDDFNSASEITLGTYTDLVLLDEDWFKVRVYAADAEKDLKVNMKGVAYMESGDLQNALTTFLKITRINYRFASAYHNLGLLYMRTQPPDVTTAINYFEKAIQANRIYKPSYLALVSIYRQQGRLEEARRYENAANSF